MMGDSNATIVFSRHLCAYAVCTCAYGLWWWYSPVHLVGPDVCETYGFPDAMANGNARSRDGTMTMKINKAIPLTLTLGN